MTPEQFRALGHRMVDWIASYMERVESLPVLSEVQPGEIASSLPASPPEHAESWESIFRDIDERIVPGVTHWQSPNFFGFFPCNASGPGILGEILSAGFNVNGMLWATSPAATELETLVLEWMRQMLALPRTFSSEGEGGAVIQGTASESTLVAMLAARRRMLMRHPGTDPSKLVAFASTQAHSSVHKAAIVSGLCRDADDTDRLRLVDVDETLAIRPDGLEEAIAEARGAGLVPFFVCATVGTTSSGAVDGLKGIGGAMGRAGFDGWLHVDAAHAGSACICPEHRWMFDGIECADSMCMNPHKWLLTNFDCDCFFTRDRSSIIDALSVTPEYLRNAATESGEVFDYRDWQIPLGRRFRALKLWMVVRHYGVEGLRAYIREHVRLAGLFEQLVQEDPSFEIAAPRTLSLVCFRLRSGDEANRLLLDRINASGELYLTHTVLPDPDRFTLRMAIGSSATREHHVRKAWEMIKAESTRG